MRPISCLYLKHSVGASQNIVFPTWKCYLVIKLTPPSLAVSSLETFYYEYNKTIVTSKTTKLTLFKQLSVCSFMLSYYWWIWWKRDNALATTTTNGGDGFCGVLTFFMSDYTAYLICLISGMSRAEMEALPATLVLSTINSIQLVLISAMERKSNK